MPTVSPLGPTSRTSGTRIRSLMRSSVLMGPPVLVRRGRPGEHLLEPAHFCPEHEEGFRATHGSPVDERVRRRASPASRDRPDDLVVLRSVRVGGGLRLSDLRPLMAGDRSVTHKGTRRGLRWQIQPRSADPAPSRAVASRTSRCPRPGRARSSPSTTNSTGPATSTSSADGPVLQRGLRGLAAVTGTGRAARGVPAPAIERSVPGEGEQRRAAVAAAHQYGGHVAGLVVRQPLLVVRHLAEHRHDRHQHAGVLQRGQRPWRGSARRSSGAASYAASAAASAGSTRPSSPAKPGSGMGAHRQRSSQIAVAWPT